VDDPTLTAIPEGVSEPAGAGGLLVVVAWHRVQSFIGRSFRFESGDTVAIGRGGADLGKGLLEDPLLSRSHASIRNVAGTWWIEDLRSRNGTKLDGIRIDRVPLPKRGVVELGSIVLVVVTAVSLEVRQDPDLLGVGPALAELQRDLDLVAQRETTVLLLGDPGTGKELCAKRIHRSSGRTGQFVAVNCAGVPDALVQSELFGHARGAFTGASGAREGLVTLAEHGTLFLDEIGDASPTLQATVLRLLQEREVRPVGQDRTRSVEVRFVSATHRDLAQEVAAGRFRADLLTRLERWVVRVPTLGDRVEDIPVLAPTLAARHAGKPVEITRELMLALLQHPWTGNVRELDGVLERAAIEAGAGPLTIVPDLFDPARKRGSEKSLDPLVAPTVPPSPARRRPDAAELGRMVEALGGNLTRLASDLGVSRPTIYKWLGEAGIDVVALRRAQEGPGRGGTGESSGA
jgi:DNA-binding NtrC family response regulator